MQSSPGSSETQESALYTDDTTTYLEPDCYPLSSSTVVLSSPLIQTPAESSSQALKLAPNDSTGSKTDSCEDKLRDWLDGQAADTSNPSVLAPGHTLGLAAPAHSPKGTQFEGSSLRIR